jgi:hypothetical protein
MKVPRQTFNLRLQSELYAALKEQARQSHRSMNEEINVRLRNTLGIIWVQTKRRPWWKFWA